MKISLLRSLNFLVIETALVTALSDFAIENFSARNFALGIGETIILTINLWGAQTSYLDVRAALEEIG